MPSVGVLLVHGIGTQAPRATLAQWTDPLLDAARRWSASQNGSVRVMTPSARLDGVSQVEARWVLPGRPGVTLIFCESRWAEEFPAPPLRAVLLWAPRMAYRAIKNNVAAPALVFSLIVLLVFLIYPPGLVWILGVGGILALVLLLAPVALVVCVAAARVLPFTKGFGVAMAGLMTTVAGDAYSLTRSQTHFAAMRARVARDIEDLSTRCDTVVVVAHSQGAVVSVETLAARTDLRVCKLLTVGAALRLLTLSEGDPVARLRTAHPDLRWINFFSQLDPVAGGRLLDPAGLFPVDVYCQNGGPAFFAHNSYVSNYEGVLLPVLMCIADAADGRPLMSELASAQLADALDARLSRVESPIVV